MDTKHVDNKIMADGNQYITMVWEWMRFKPINEGNVYKVHEYIYASFSVTSKEIWDFPFSH